MSLAADDHVQPTLSVIIPCWNDGDALRSQLAILASLIGIDQVIVADASRSPECRALAAAYAADTVQCAEPNRGAQMNAGARSARSDVLLFQHADTRLTQAHVVALREAMCDNSLGGGAFHRNFDERHSALRWLERVARMMSHCGGTLYGDQSVFVRHSVFIRMGGFAEIPLMEDVEFSRRLRRSGRIAVLDPPIASSPRHHQRRGAWRTSMRNCVIIALYRAGVPPAQLHAWYYRRPVYD